MDIKTKARLVFGIVEDHFSKSSEKLFVKDIKFPGINKDDIESIILSLGSRGKFVLNTSSPEHFIEKIS